MSSYHALSALFLCLICGFFQSALADTAPTSAPATTVAERRVRVVPPGFVAVDLFGREVLCLSDDAQVIRKLVIDIESATRPTTTALDLITSYQSLKPALIKTVTADLGLDNPDAVTAWLDDNLEPQLQALAKLDPPVVYLFIDKPGLKQIVKAGWGDPQFRYNKVADDIEMNLALDVSTDHPPDDAVLPVVYETGTGDTERAALLEKTIQEAEDKLAHGLAQRSIEMLQVGLVQMIADVGIKQLDLKRDQLWWGMGAAGMLSTKYVATITGISRAEMMEAITHDFPRNPVKMARVDLLNMTSESDLRRDVIPLYLDAARRKSAAVVWNWSQQAGERRIGEAFKAIREKKPADGIAIAAILKDLSGEDIAAKLVSSP